MEKRHSETSNFTIYFILLPLSSLLCLPIYYIIDISYGMALLLTWMVLMFLFSSFLTKKIYYLNNKNQIRLKNEKAKELIANIKNGKNTQKYFVYLRSFRLENNKQDWYSNLYRDEHNLTTTFDDELAYALNSINIDLICLGDNRKLKLGATRLQTNDEDWRDTVDLLLKHATGIIIIPAFSESIIEEVFNIYNNEKNSKKSVFIMLPIRLNLYNSIIWSQMIEELEKVDVKLPNYKKEGMIFNLRGYNVEFSNYLIQNHLDLLHYILEALKQ